MLLPEAERRADAVCEGHGDGLEGRAAHRVGGVLQAVLALRVVHELGDEAVADLCRKIEVGNEFLGNSSRRGPENVRSGGIFYGVL